MCCSDRRGSRGNRVEDIICLCAVWATAAVATRTQWWNDRFDDPFPSSVIFFLIHILLLFIALLTFSPQSTQKFLAYRVDIWYTYFFISIPRFDNETIKETKRVESWVIHGWHVLTLDRDCPRPARALPAPHSRPTRVPTGVVARKIATDLLQY